MPDLYPDVQILPGSTSYFSENQPGLDPHLFDEGGVLREEARQELLSMLQNHLDARYAGAQQWMRAWIAGSGVSYQWNPEVGDLDVLLGVDFTQFRAMNPGWDRMSDQEIAKEINQDLYEDLRQDLWHGLWEVTFYVNPDSWDIRAINPYAAYDLINNDWTVPPSPGGAPKNKYWEEASARDHAKANTIVGHYERALTALRGASNPAGRVNAERALQHSIDQGIALFDSIHQGRKSSFSRVGAGYADWGNYRWQAGKASGVIPALRMLKQYREETKTREHVQTYGLELPSTDTLIRRAAARRVHR